jgi:pilus assembly protein Flp/PilA
MSMKNLLRRLLRQDEGQDLIEYALLIGIITLAAITAMELIGPKVAAYFTTLNGDLP